MNRISIVIVLSLATTLVALGQTPTATPCPTAPATTAGGWTVSCWSPGAAPIAAGPAPAAVAPPSAYAPPAPIASPAPSGADALASAVAEAEKTEKLMSRLRQPGMSYGTVWFLGVILVLVAVIAGIYVWDRSQHYPTIRTRINPATGTANINFVPNLAAAAARRARRGPHP